VRLSILLLLTTALCAQEPREFSGTLAAELASLGAGPFWVGYSEPIVAGHHSDSCVSSTLHLEGDTALVVLIRVERGVPGQLRVTSPDCHVDAGGVPFYWLNGVPASESIAWLKTQVTETAVMAIALHRDAAADQALDDLASATSPVEVRKRAAFWLGTARGAHGIATLKRMLAGDPAPDVRDRVVFALAQSKDPGGIPLVIEAARNDRDPHLRGQALFWLAQKAAAQVSKQAIQNALTNDPDSAVRERAVFALTRLPNGEGVPMLIELATSHRDPAVRKKAMFWLGQSKDPRALDFLALVLQP
jgi:HEAT repeat protein